MRIFYHPEHSFNPNSHRTQRELCAVLQQLCLYRRAESLAEVRMQPCGVCPPSTHTHFDYLMKLTQKQTGASGWWSASYSSEAAQTKPPAAVDKVGNQTRRV